MSHTPHDNAETLSKTDDVKEDIQARYRNVMQNVPQPGKYSVVQYYMNCLNIIHSCYGLLKDYPLLLRRIHCYYQVFLLSDQSDLFLLLGLQLLEQYHYYICTSIGIQVIYFSNNF